MTCTITRAVQGIGDCLAKAPDGKAAMGSAKLQNATGPICLGPHFEEFLEDGDHRYRNYANAVGWIAHELGHRWGIALQFRNPLDGKVVSLSSGDSHWSEFLHTPSMISVWQCSQTGNIQRA